MGPVDDPPRARRASRSSGLLAHPHTSAGRVPTEAGYRYYVDRLLPEPSSAGPRALSLSLVRRELDEAMRVTTETLSQVTNLLAIVTAPPIETSTIRHVEVLLLQPQVLMVVVITSTGGVTKRLFTFERPGRPRARRLGASYLNERLVGLGLGRADAPPAARTTRRCRRPSASSSTRWRRRSPSSRSRAEDTCTSTAPRGCCPSDAFQDLSAAQRADGHARAARGAARGAALGAGRAATCASGSAPRTRRPRCARWRSSPPATACPQRSLGAVSVIGPLRMDYAGAIRAVREAAAAALALRRRRLRRAMSATGCPATTTRCWASPATPTSRDQEGVPPAGPRAAPRRQHATTPTPRRSSRRPPRPTRSCPTPSAARPTTATGTRACAAAATRRTSTASARSRTSSRRSSAAAPFGELFGGGGARRRRVQGGDIAVAVEITLAEAAARRHGRGLLRGGRALRALPRQRRRAGHADRDLRHAAGAPGQLRAVDAHAFGQLVRDGRLRRVRRRRPGRRATLQGVRRPRAQGRAPRSSTSTSRPASTTASGSGSPGAVTPASAAGRRATCTCSSGSREDARFVRDGDDLVTVVDVPAPLAALGHDGRGADARRRASRWRSRPAPSRGES